MQLRKARSVGAVIIMFIVAIILLNGCSRAISSYPDPIAATEEHDNNVRKERRMFTEQDILKFLPSKQHKIVQTLWCDLDNDGVDELAVITRNFEPPSYGNPEEDARFMVFKQTGDSVAVALSGKMPGCGTGQALTFRIGKRVFLAINDWFGADGVPIASAVTMKDGTMQPYWIGRRFEDIDGDGTIEGVYYELSGGQKLPGDEVYEWDEVKQSFVNSQGKSLENRYYWRGTGLELLQTFTSLIARKNYTEAAKLFSDSMRWNLIMWGYEPDPIKYLEEMFGDSTRDEISLKINHSSDKYIEALITRKHGSTPFYAVFEAGGWHLEFGELDYD